MQTLSSLLLALGFAIIARAQEPQLFDVTPTDAGGIMISVLTKDDEMKRLDLAVKLGIMNQAEADQWKGKLPAITLLTSITRKSPAAAKASNFTVLVRDAHGKELAKQVGKREPVRKNPIFAGDVASVSLGTALMREPEWPLKVELKDALNGKSEVFSIEPRKAK